MQKVINRGTRTLTLNEVNPVKNIRKNPPSFVEITSVQKGVLPSYYLQDYAYE